MTLHTNELQPFNRRTGYQVKGHAAGQSRIPLTKPQLPQFEEIAPHVRTMLASGKLTNFGPFSQLLEKGISEFVGVTHTVTVSSATTGLCILLSLLPRHSEVVVPSFTFISTLQAIEWNQLVPVFADIDPETLNLSPDSVKQVLTNRTSAILAVHVFGVPAGIEELQALATESGVYLFFDSAHAFGAMHKEKYVGQFGDGEVFSFSATKLLVCGEGGAITTKHADIYESLLKRRNYGRSPSSRDCTSLGLNGKISEFGAILGTLGLANVEGQVKRRNEIASMYIAGLQDCPGLSFQKVPDTDRSTYKDFALLCDPNKLRVDRDFMAEALVVRGVETGMYFSPAAHQTKHFAASAARANLSTTELVQERILCLPMYSDLRDEEVEFVTSAVQEVIEKGRTHQ